MEFRLIYQGELKPNGDKTHKHEIRVSFHRQIRELWKYPPLNVFYGERQEPGHLLALDPTFISDQHKIGECKFIPLVRRQIHLICELDILFLRPEHNAEIIKGGDIDNRLKTLFDSLRIPISAQEIPDGYIAQQDENPLYCLLEDDSLITKLSVTPDTILDRPSMESFASLVIHVRIRETQSTWQNAGLGS